MPLSGLSAAEIPDGDRQHCTGGCGIINYSLSGSTYDEVWLNTERSFLDEVINLMRFLKLYLS
ncbi:MAG: hypothetical protein HEQ35_20480 [Gloeotrichia echinulata IR180]